MTLGAIRLLLVLGSRHSLYLCTVKRNRTVSEQNFGKPRPPRVRGVGRTLTSGMALDAAPVTPRDSVSAERAGARHTYARFTALNMCIVRTVSLLCFL
jgi:hypothetical protein